MILVKSMDILYGGAFNPPTIAHYQIIKFITQKFANCKLIILPANNSYKQTNTVDVFHRVKMLELLIKDLPGDINISDYELKLDKFLGTYYTLKHFNHPYFVIGADQLASIETWIKYPDIIIENKFIVFPRNNIDISAIIANNKILNQNKNHFIFIDFEEINISSSMFREKHDNRLINQEIYEYIKENKLYEV